MTMDHPDTAPASFDDAVEDAADAATPPSAGASPSGVDPHLQQNDIDRLLDTPAGTGGQPTPSVMQLIADSTIVNYERLPMLDVVMDRFVRTATDNLRQLMGASVLMDVESIGPIRFGEYISTVPMPTAMAVLKAPEWDGSSMFVFDTRLVGNMVEVLLGAGNKRQKTPEIRPLTSIEQRLMRRVSKHLADCLGAAFEPVSSVSFDVDQFETTPQLAQICRATNVAALVRIRVNVNDLPGYLDLVIPYATLEPVRAMLLQVFMGESFGGDCAWEHHFKNELMKMTVDLRAILSQSRITLGEALGWTKGTQIILDMSPDSTVRLLLRGQELLRGEMGQRNGNIAVKVDESLVDQQSLSGVLPT